MKEAFPTIRFGRPDAAAVAIQITEPLTVFWVGKVRESVVVHRVVPGGEIRPPGQRPGQEQGVERLAVRPPKFQICFKRMRRRPVQVRDVTQPSELAIPTMIKRSERDVDRRLQQVLIAAPLGDLHQHPCTLDSVAGMEHTALRQVEQWLAVRCHVLQ